MSLHLKHRSRCCTDVGYCFSCRRLSLWGCIRGFPTPVHACCVTACMHMGCCMSLYFIACKPPWSVHAFCMHAFCMHAFCMHAWMLGQIKRDNCFKGFKLHALGSSTSLSFQTPRKRHKLCGNSSNTRCTYTLNPLYF